MAYALAEGNVTRVEGCAKIGLRFNNVQYVCPLVLHMHILHTFLVLPKRSSTINRF
jgi:hypothetical protein